MKHKTHVDTVLAFRERYLQNFDKKETSKRFLQYKEGVIWLFFTTCCVRIVAFSIFSGCMFSLSLHVIIISNDELNLVWYFKIAI